MPFKETRIMSIAPATVPAWAVFTKGEPEIWTERIHLWAHVAIGYDKEDKEHQEFLGNDVPADKVEGMVLTAEGEVLVVHQREMDGVVFLGYSDTEEPTPLSEWKGTVNQKRRSQRRRLYDKED